MKIPYGDADFAKIRRSDYFYADKTMFLPTLEDLGGASHLVFLRPRRFGKSTLISLLEHYYDQARAGEFDTLFKGLWVHAHPTPEKSAYLVLRFDFSAVDTSSDDERLYRTFASSVMAGVRRLCGRYAVRYPALARFDPDYIERQDPVTLIKLLLTDIGLLGQKVYVLVDEYDNFANDLLARRRSDAYFELLGDTGFVRTLFKAFKEGAGMGVVARTFTTGVTPMMLDDLASGFNIATQVSAVPALNALCGFTRAEVEEAVETFRALTPDLASRETLLSDLEQFYDGYLFAEDGEERLYNPELVLYYFAHWRNYRKPPREMLDINVKVDYTKLRMLAMPGGGTQTWQHDQIETLMNTGTIEGDLVERFSARELYHKDHFITLLQCMGLLTIAGQSRSKLSFRVPNLVSARMHWEGFVMMFSELTKANVDASLLTNAIEDMAYSGNLETMVTLLKEGVLAKLSRRDHRKFDERYVKLIFLAYLSLSPIYLPLSELEHRYGYSDLFLGLDGRFPDAKYAWMLEFKHLKSGAGPGEIEAAYVEARAQLDKYLLDDRVVALVKRDRILRAASIVSIGKEDLQFRLEVE